jgi:hypothetical protein
MMWEEGARVVFEGGLTLPTAARALEREREREGGRESTRTRTVGEGADANTRLVLGWRSKIGGDGEEAGRELPSQLINSAYLQDCRDRREQKAEIPAARWRRKFQEGNIQVCLGGE